MTLLMYVESKKKLVQINLFKNRNRVTDVENKLMVTRGKGKRDKLGDWD